MLRILLAAVIVTSIACSITHADNWPQFRGPDGQGHAASLAPTSWSESENIAWKTPLPGKGWSSPVVWGDQIWLTTAIVSEAPKGEAEDKIVGLLPPEAAQLASQVSLRALCLDKNTGELLQNIELFEPEKVEVIHSLNSYASPTPVIEQGRLYCHFGTYGNACVNTDTGEILWRRVLPVEHYVGPGSSPVLYGELLILTYDGADRQFITALNTTTGETIWQTDRPPIRDTNPDFRKSYSTPLVIRSSGRDQLVGTASQWFCSYNPNTGDELWRMDHGHGFSVVPRVVESNGVVYFSSGFSGGEMIAVRVDGRGDVTQTHVVGRSRRQTPMQSSPLIVGDRLYTVSETGVGVCLDKTLSSVLWQKRIGGNYSASPLLVGDKVLFFSRGGVTTVVADRDDGPEIVRKNRLDGQIMATPAVVDGKMFLRTDTHLYAVSE